jgi:hypothetical protein
MVKVSLRRPSMKNLRLGTPLIDTTEGQKPPEPEKHTV